MMKIYFVDFVMKAIPQSDLTNRQNLKSHIENNFDFSIAQPLIKLYEDYLERFPDVDGFNHFYDKLSMR